MNLTLSQKKTLELSTSIEKSWQYITQQPTHNLRIAQDPQDFTIWHFLIFGLPRPFQGGEYYGVLKFYERFPVTQPSVCLFTPNGLLDVNTDLFLFNHVAWQENPSPLRCLETVAIYLQDPRQYQLPAHIHPFSYEVSSIQNLAIISKTVNATNRKCVQLFSNEPHPIPSSSGTTPSASLSVQQNSSHSQTSSQHSSSSASSSPTGLRSSFDQTISSLNPSLMSVSEMQLILQHESHLPKKNLTNSGGAQTEPFGASPSNHNARGPISRSRERDDEDVVFDHPSLRLLHAGKQPHSSLSQSQDEIPRDKIADGIEAAIISNGAKQLQLPDLENVKSSNPSSQTIPITIMSCGTSNHKTGNQALRSPQHHLQSLAQLHQPHYPTSSVQSSIPQPLNVSSTSISSSPSCSPSTSSSSLFQSSVQGSPGLGVSSDDDESFRKPNEKEIIVNNEELSLSAGGTYTPRPQRTFNESVEQEREEILHFLRDQSVLLLRKLIPIENCVIIPPKIKLMEHVNEKINGNDVVNVEMDFTNNSYLQINFWGERVLEEEFREKSRRIVVSMLDSLMNKVFEKFAKRIVFANMDFTNTGVSMRAIFNGTFGKKNIHRETEIEKLNLSRTSTSANALENLFRLTNLQELYLDYCAALSHGGGKSVFSILAKKDPILKLKLLSVVGTSSALSHTWLSELGPACPNIQHIYFTRKRGTKSLGWQDIILLQTMRKPILLPCGHIGDNSSIKIGYCGLDRVPFTSEDVVPLEPMISYLFKSPCSSKWSVHVVDYLRHPLDSKTYYHRSCNHFFNSSSLKELYGFEDQQVKISDLHNVKCVVCGNSCQSLHVCFPHSVEMPMDTQQFEDLHQVMAYSVDGLKRREKK